METEQKESVLKALTVIVPIVIFIIVVIITQNLLPPDPPTVPPNPSTESLAVLQAMARVEEKGFKNAEANDMIIYSLVHLERRIDIVGEKVFSRLARFETGIWAIFYSFVAGILTHFATKFWGWTGNHKIP